MHLGIQSCPGQELLSENAVANEEWSGKPIQETGAWKVNAKTTFSFYLFIVNYSADALNYLIILYIQ